jgi:hypothetical protein
VLRRADYMVIGFFVLLLIAVVVLYFTTGVGKFGGPIDLIR